MTNNPNDATNIGLRLAVDEATLARSQQGLNLLSQRLQTLRADTRSAGADIKTALGGVSDGVAKATPLMDRLAQASKQAAEEARKAAGNWNDLRDSLNNAGGSGGGAAGGGFGIEGLRRTGGALSQIGLGAIGNPVRIAGDFAQIGKEFKLLGEQVPALASSLEEMPGIFGAVATAGAGVAGSFGAILAVAGPLVLVAGGVALGIKAISDELAKEKEWADQYISALDGVAKAEQTLTTQQAQAEQDKLSAAVAADQKEQKLIKEKLAAIGADENTIAIASPVTEALQKKYWDLDKAIKSNTEIVNQYTDAINANAFATNDSTQAFKEQTAAQLKAAKDKADTAKQEYADSQLSADAAKKKAEQLKINIDADQQELSALMALGNESPEVQNRIQQLKDTLKANGEEWDKLRSIFIPAAEAAKKLADAHEKAKKAAEEAAKAEEANNKAIASSMQKYKDDVANIEQKSAEQRAAINQKLADTLVAEAQKALEQSQDALRKLQDKRADLLTDYQRNEQDAQQKASYDNLTLQINAERENEKALQDHVVRLKEIQRSAWADEQQALLDRNFVALAKSRLTTTTSMQSENDSFGRGQQDRIRALQESKQDAERQRAQEHQQRLQAYQQANADANKQYQRELRDQQIARERAIQAAQKQHDQELQLLAQKTRAELDARAKSEKAELDIMLKGAKARVELETQTQQALLNEAKAFAGARISTNTANPHTGTQFLSVGSGLARRAGGGPLSAGQASFVNEGGRRESFDGQMLPGGAGIFYPLKSGSVSNGGGGVQLHQENHISGVNDPKMAADLIRQHTVELLEQVL